MAAITETVMLGSSVRSFARQVGRLGLLTVVVVVLTFLFNLVGTLCVSVITGMMAGASRRFNWQVISVSLVPPAVAVALGYITKVNFEPRQWLTLPGVCLGSFWVTWAATYLLISLEKKSAPSRRSLASVGSTTAPGSEFRGQQSDIFPGTQLSDAASKAGEVEDRLRLDDLQGTWCCESNRPDGASTKKVFVVEEGKFSFSIVNDSGHSRLVARGDVVVQDTESQTKLVISKPSEAEGEGIEGV